MQMKLYSHYINSIESWFISFSPILPLNIYNGIIFPSLNPAKKRSVQFPITTVNKKFGSGAESHA